MSTRGERRERRASIREMRWAASTRARGCRRRIRCRVGCKAAEESRSELALLHGPSLSLACPWVRTAGRRRAGAATARILSLGRKPPWGGGSRSQELQIVHD